MRWVTSFILMAVFFGIATEGFQVMDTDEPFSPSSAALRGASFSTIMTLWFMWTESRQSRETGDPDASEIGADDG